MDEEALQVAAVEAFFDSPDAQLTLGDPPLLTRKQKQARRGMPEPANLAKLARVYLETMHRLWPELVTAGVLPPLTDAAVRQMAADFERRFVSGEPDEFTTPTTARLWKALAAAYVRYSDDNSSPRSLDDQLVKELHKGRQEGRFTPWAYVFADASVTGRTHLRRGYRLAKEAMERFRKSDLDTLYFDDFGRATRSILESFRLAKLIERLRKRLIGLDGFDLSSPGAEVQVMAAGLFNSMFIRQLRDKVIRGMKGAARRGTSTGKVRFGYRLVPQTDARGRVVMNGGKNKDRPIKVPAIDPAAMELVVQAARWFCDDNKSYKWIARQLNAMAAGGRANWTGSEVGKMLACPIYIGVVIYNRTRTVFDEETGEFTVEPNPRSEWIIRQAPELRAWDDNLWRKVRRRAAVVRKLAPNTGKQYKIRELYPVTLLHGILVCDDCGREMDLVRCVGKYKQYGCPNGCNHVNGCRQTSSKSVRTADGAVIEYVGKQVLTAERIRALVGPCNRYLEAEAKKPKIPTQPLKRRLQKAIAAEQDVTDFVMANRTKHDMTSYLRRGDKFREEIADLQRQLRAAEATNAAPPPPLDEKAIVEHLGDLRGLLNQSVEKSAVLLRALLGKIVVHERREPGKRRATWVGTICGDLVPFLTQAARDGNYLSRDTLEFLSGRGQTMPFTAEITLGKRPKYERLLDDPRFVTLADAGKTPAAIARALGLCRALVVDAVRFWKTGRRPKVRPVRPQRRRRKAGQDGDSGRDLLYVTHAAEAARLKDEEGKTFPQIAKILGISPTTAERAYWYFHRDKLLAAALAGQKPPTVKYSLIGFRKVEQVRQLAAEGLGISEVALKAGVSQSTVRRIVAAA